MDVRVVLSRGNVNNSPLLEPNPSATGVDSSRSDSAPTAPPYLPLRHPRARSVIPENAGIQSGTRPAQPDTTHLDSGWGLPSTPIEGPE